MQHAGLLPGAPGTAQEAFRLPWKGMDQVVEQDEMLDQVPPHRVGEPIQSLRAQTAGTLGRGERSEKAGGIRGTPSSAT